MNYYSGQKDLGDNPRLALENEMIVALSYALEMGFFKAFGIELKTIAKRTGRMRATIEGEAVNQIAAQSGQTSIHIFIPESKVATITDYVRHHWNVGGSYKLPSTPGTKPIDTMNINLNVGQAVYNALVQAFSQQLLDVAA